MPPLLNPPMSANQPDAPANAWKTFLIELIKSFPIIGPAVAKVIDTPGGTALLQLLISFVLIMLIYPMLLVLIVTTVLKSDWMPESWRHTYAEYVREAFRVEESTKQFGKSDHQLLDYFQALEFHDSANLPKAFSFSIKPYQRLVIRSHEVAVTTATCNLPIKKLINQPLFLVKAGDVELMSLYHGRQEIREPKRAKWELLVEQMIGGSPLVLTIVPTPLIKELNCKDLLADVRLSVEVFKDLVDDAPAIKP